MQPHPVSTGDAPAERTGVPRVPGLLLGCVVAAAYLPGLGGPFILDDHVNFQPLFAWWQGGLGLLDAALNNPSGPFGRGIAYLSFALNMQLFGPGPFGFKLFNLALHLATALALAALLRQLLLHRGAAERPAALLAALGAAAWAVHPLQVSTVLYAVQRMEILSALAQLLGLLAYVDGRRRMLAGRDGGMIRVAVAFPAAVLAGLLCKENALMAVPLALAIEMTVLDSGRQRRVPAALAALLAAAALAVAAWLWLQPDWLLGGYAGREFSVEERLLTQPRVLASYLAASLLPVDGQLYLFRDGFPLSRSLTQPASTSWALLGLGLLAVAAFALRRRHPWIALGLLWWLIGHAMEASFLPLEMAFEHRNYLELAGLVMVAFGLISNISMAPSRPQLVGVVALLLVLWVLCISRSHAWGDMDRLLAAESPPAEQVSRRLQLVMMARSLEIDDFAGANRALDRLGQSNPDDATVAALWRVVLDCTIDGQVRPGGAANLLESRPSVLTQQHVTWLGMLARRTSEGQCAGFDPSMLRSLLNSWLHPSRKPPQLHSRKRIEELIDSLKATHAPAAG